MRDARTSTTVVLIKNSTKCSKISFESDPEYFQNNKKVKRLLKPVVEPRGEGMWGGPDPPRLQTMGPGIHPKMQKDLSLGRGKPTLLFLLKDLMKYSYNKYLTVNFAKRA